MKVCTVCKTPIEEGLELVVNGKFVHPGVCHSFLKEHEESLNESAEVEDIQMIL